MCTAKCSPCPTVADAANYALSRSLVVVAVCPKNERLASPVNKSIEHDFHMVHWFDGRLVLVLCKSRGEAVVPGCEEIESCKGTIYFYSDGENRGTTFMFSMKMPIV